ncbi:MAG: acetyl-CoA carboxylase biotin carboxyl carrier protein [Limnochordia bacterium]
MKLEDIKGLMAAMDHSQIAELELEMEGFQLKLKKATGEVVQPVAPLPKEPAAPPVQEEVIDENLVIITAPMVGTFYRAPAPDAPPYVKVGDRIQRGQPLCIIEAMKLMNEIESDVSGIIKEILVDNAQPVEFGQPLFTVEKLD